MREEFEAWLDDCAADIIPGCHGTPWAQAIALAEAAWQASRAAVVVELPELSVDVTFDDNSIEFYWPDDVISAIESTGIRVK